MEKYRKLKTFNQFMGFLHLVQGLVMVYLATTVEKVMEFTPTIYTYFLTYDKAEMRLMTESKELFDFPFAMFVAIFLLISALFHFIIATRPFNNYYNDGIEKGINKFRWYEYSISSSLMIVLIAILFGIYNIATLILIFFLNASMNLFGLLMEKLNQYTHRTNWEPFIYGTIAGLIPWIVIIMYGFGNTNPEEVPWFVYAVFGSYFVFFNLFPINMILQYRKKGKWKEYIYGEKIYIVLSLTAKTILAWLVFFGIMQPN